MGKTSFWQVKPGPAKAIWPSLWVMEAIALGYNAWFSSLSDLMEKVHESMACGRIPALKRKLMKQDVIILDEVGCSGWSARPMKNGP
jgi:hypothetical protein